MNSSKQSITQFKRRVMDTYTLATLPVYFLFSYILETKNIFTVSFGIILSPIILASSMVTFSLALIAGLTQILFFPIQLIINKIGRHV